MFDVTAACADVQIMDRKTGDVAVVPKRKKVAIIGFATNTLHLVPWQDPTFELWGMNQAHLHFPRRADRWFEMHLPEYTADVRDPTYLQFLKTTTIPVYMIDAYDDMAASVRYPIEAAIQYAGRDYFTSSIAFMLCLAGMEGFEEIHLYGINLAIGDEYFYEKPCAEWWLGKLDAMGKKIYIPTASSLLKQYYRYGYSIDARPNQMTKMLLTNRIGQYRDQAQKHLNDYHLYIGALRECESLLQVAEGLDKGADVVLMPAPPVST